MSFDTRSLSRSLLFATAIVLLLPSARASNEEVVPTDTALAQLELRAQSAQPREQCFLYVELVHDLTEIAGKQLASGDSLGAGATLKRVDALAQKIHMALARDTKRLKNAEMLLHHTTHRLADMVHVAAGDDKPTLQSTLKRLDTVQSELLTAVFAH